MEYKNLEELGENILKLNDKVSFNHGRGVLNYTVESTRMRLTYNYFDTEDVIFQILNLDKFELARNHYGYETTSNQNGFPYYLTNDFLGLTRLVKNIWEKINFLNHSPKENKKLEENIYKLHYSKNYIDLNKLPETFICDSNYYKEKLFNALKVPSQFLDTKYPRPYKQEIIQQSINKTKNGKPINVSPKSATIATGKRPTGVGLSGRRHQSTIKIGYLSNKPINY